MSDIYDPEKTKILAALREAIGLTQHQAAEYFGLKGKKRRDSVGGWERGTARPSTKRRSRFVYYLWDKLGLRHRPQQFQEIWKDVMEGEWRWLELSKDELPRDFPREKAYEKQPSHVPFQAIADIQYFVGRKQELLELEKALLDESYGARCVLHGMAGVGKTVLAAHSAYRLRSYFSDGVLWARVDTSESMDIVSTFASAYGRDVSQYKDLDSRSRVLREILAQKRVLVVLDNVVTNEQIEHLLPPTTGSCAVIVTTRNASLPSMLGARWLHIQPFHEEEETSELFTRILGQERTKKKKKLLAEMGELLGHLPLAVAIAAGRLAHEAGWGISDFLEQLDREKARLEELIFGDWSVRLSFSMSYDTLPPDLQKFWSKLGVFSGEDFSVEAVAYVAETSLTNAQINLRKLYGLSLVQEGRSRRYRLHPLLHDYAVERTIDDKAFERMAKYYGSVLRRANDLYQQGGELINQGLDLFDIEWENIRAAQKWSSANAEKNEVAMELCITFAIFRDFLQVRLHPDEYIRWLEPALNSARRLEDSVAEGELLGGLGIVYRRLSKPQQAIDFHRQALEIFRKIGDRQRIGLILSFLGGVYHDLSKNENAIKYYKQALEIAREFNNRDNESTVLNQLGNAYHDLGKNSQAVECFEQSLEIAHVIGDRRGESYALNNLGTVYRGLSDYHRAIEFFEKALAIFQELNDRYAEGSALGNLGNSLYGLGEYTDAFEFYKKQLFIARDIGHRRGEAYALMNMGNVNLELDNPSQAVDFFQKALDIFREIRNSLGEGITLSNLGEAYTKLSDLSRAISFYKQSLNIANNIGYRKGQGIVLLDLGKIYVTLGQSDLAIGLYREALEIAHDMGDLANEADALWHIGLALNELDKGDQAVAHVVSALDIYEKIGADKKAAQVQRQLAFWDSQRYVEDDRGL